ncbi:MAG: alpha/beta hydrolase [Daejeonella sp.]|uniref:alpha/beta fold hydrolase n=1 Tax=Daejeonella sp. TaxID=2805397 RepID=UPI002735FC36|nr:alpha/beta hydrolase [Daejeonella sp.]MDP3468818.1 alpha/beta hydrolase [Daejeonella sp.]
MEKLAKGYNLISRINNFNLSYDDLGEGSVPLIFLHGFPFSKQMWKEQLEFLKSSHRVIACDLRGFGNSIDEESVLSIDLFGDDLIQFMDYLNIDKAIVCGLSMGGYIALNAYKRYSDRFEALILCDTQCIADTPEGKAKRYKLIDEIALKGTEDFSKGFVNNVFFKDSLTEKKEIVEELRNVISSNSMHIISMGLRALAERSESCTILSQVNIPTLIICGREDQVTPLAQSEFMNKNIEGSILRIINHAGHVSNLEQAHEFNKHLHEFLK